MLNEVIQLGIVIAPFLAFQRLCYNYFTFFRCAYFVQNASPTRGKCLTL